MSDQPTTKPHLLPCPFCGGAAELRKPFGQYKARCTSCYVEVYHGEFKAQSAIKEWNRRATTQDPQL